MENKKRKRVVSGLFSLDPHPNPLPKGEGPYYEPHRLGRTPHVGAGGSFVARSTGCSLSMRIASVTARSSCGSRPAMTSLGQFSTSTSGATPSFSTAHFPLRAQKPPRGAIAEPPSTKVGVSAVWTRPPHVRLPTSKPSFRL